MERGGWRQRAANMLIGKDTRCGTVEKHAMNPHYAKIGGQMVQMSYSSSRNTHTHTRNAWATPVARKTIAKQKNCACNVGGVFRPTNQLHAGLVGEGGGSGEVTSKESGTLEHLKENPTGDVGGHGPRKEHRWSQGSWRQFPLCWNNMPNSRTCHACRANQVEGKEESRLFSLALPQTLSVFASYPRATGGRPTEKTTHTNPRSWRLV